jgi:hypothetical protein
METILGYHVFDSEAGQWLAEDERSWTPSFAASNAFTSFTLAADAMESTGGDYVLACMGVK